MLKKTLNFVNVKKQKTEDRKYGEEKDSVQSRV